MRRLTSLLLSAVALAGLVPALVLIGPTRPAAGQESKKPKAKKAATELDGAWRLVSNWDSRSNQMRKLPEGVEMTKLIVGGRYSWSIVRDEKLLAGAGGSYTVKNDEYTETVIFTAGPNQQAMAGKSFKFTWKIEDGKWHHTGTMKIGNAEQKIDEIWERIP